MSGGAAARAPKPDIPDPTAANLPRAEPSELARLVRIEVAHDLVRHRRRLVATLERLGRHGGLSADGRVLVAEAAGLLDHAAALTLAGR